MKKLSPLFVLILATMATQSQGTTVAGINGLTLLSAGDSVSGTSNFLNYESATAADTISQETLRSNLADNELGTYVLSIDPVAYIDIAFTSADIFNGAGNDLAFFFVGSVDSSENVIINFDLSINGIINNYTPEITPVRTIITDSFGSYTLTAAQIDLDDFGLGYASATALQDFRVLLGTDNSLNLPALTMVGGFYTSPAPIVIPLPLPVVLFASGLGALGLFARRKSLE